jgi:hypothetical protein
MISNPPCASAERRLPRRWLWGLALALLLQPSAWAAGVVTHLSGVLSVVKPDGQARILSIQSQVLPGDELVSEDKTFARIRFSDSGNMVIRPNSRVRIDAYTYVPDSPQEDNALVNLVKGGMRMVTGVVAKRNPERFETRTPTAVLGIRGTHFGVLMCQADCGAIQGPSQQPIPDGLHVDVIQGTVYLANAAGRLDMGTGQFGFVPTVQEIPRQVSPQEGVRVTVPPSMVAPNGGGLTIGRNSNDAQCVVQ